MKRIKMFVILLLTRVIEKLIDIDCDADMNLNSACVFWENRYKFYIKHKK